MVRSVKSFRLYDPHIVDLVDPHLSRRMDDLIRIQEDADMRDSPFAAIEKSQITGPRLFQESNRLPLTGLQIRIPQQGDAEEFEYALSEAAAVDAKNAFSSPEIRRIQKFVGELPDRFRVGICLRRIPYPTLVMNVVLPPFCVPVLHPRQLAAHRDHHRMTIVFEGGYPFGRQRLPRRLILRFIDLRQMRWLAPAFIPVKFDPDPVPVTVGLVQYFATFAK